MYCLVIMTIDITCCSVHFACNGHDFSAFGC